MILLGQASKKVIRFLVANGFCPWKAAEVPMCPDVMLQWVKGTLTDKQAVKALTNLEILTGKSLRPDKKGEDGEQKAAGEKH